MDEVQRRRAQKEVRVLGKTYGIHDFVSFYFNSRNPMLYKRRNIQHELVVILVSSNIISNKPKDNSKNFTIVTDGNAGSEATKFYTINKIENVPIKLIKSGTWNCDDPQQLNENRRQMCSEVLVYPMVGINDIVKIACPNQIMVSYVLGLKNKYSNSNHIIVELMPDYFF